MHVEVRQLSSRSLTLGSQGQALGVRNPGSTSLVCPGLHVLLSKSLPVTSSYKENEMKEGKLYFTVQMSEVQKGTGVGWWGGKCQGLSHVPSERSPHQSRSYILEGGRGE